MYCKTALAQAEVEYEDQKTPSVWVKFPLTSVPADLQSTLGGRPVFAVIWTTTPWTLPANLAIAVHPTQSYVALEIGGEGYVLARALASDLLGRFQEPPDPTLADLGREGPVGPTGR